MAGHITEETDRRKFGPWWTATATPPLLYFPSPSQMFGDKSPAVAFGSTHPALPMINIHRSSFLDSIDAIAALAALGGCLLLIMFLLATLALIKRRNKLKNEARRQESPHPAEGAQRPYEMSEYATISNTQREQSNNDPVERARVPTNTANTRNANLPMGASSLTYSELVRTTERADLQKMPGATTQQSTKTHRKESATKTTKFPSRETVQYCNIKPLDDSQNTNAVHTAVVAKNDGHDAKGKHTQKQNKATTVNPAIGNRKEDIADVYSTLRDTNNTSEAKSAAASNTYDSFVRR